MRIVVAPDKFKGSLSAPDAAEAIAKGAARANPLATIDCVPMADGGEGTVEALVKATGGRVMERTVTGPMGEPRRAWFGLLGDGRTAVIEMAAASGLILVPQSVRDPRRATTKGTGELLLEAIDSGASRVILGIGGSATNDGGAGLARALGYSLLDRDGNALEPGGGPLRRLDRIESSRRDPRLKGVEIAVACDVDNPLCGPRGASVIFGPQKGATLEMVAELDAALAHFATIIERDLGIAVADLPGAGAAGGLGAGLVAFADGRLEPGVELVIRAVGLADRLEGASLCLTGEGSLDGSSVGGKTAVGVARLARSLCCPTFALAGTIGPGAEAVLEEGIDAYFSICPGPIPLDEAMARAFGLLDLAAEQAVRAFLVGQRTRGRDSHET